MDREVPERPLSVFGWGRWFILPPSARTGPSRLGPAGEGRSDGGVLHLHPQGQARYPEGGRRREDEPPRERVARTRQMQETTSTRATRTWRTLPYPGLPPRTPRRMGCRPRCFNPSLPTRHAAGSSLHQRGGTPHPEFGWLGRATQNQGPSRSVTVTGAFASLMTLTAVAAAHPLGHATDLPSWSYRPPRRTIVSASPPYQGQAATRSLREP